MEVSRSDLEIVGTFPSFLGRRCGNSSSPHIVLIVPAD